MNKINLVFLCTEFDTTDYLPQDQEFIKIKDVNDFLWEMYESEISGNLGHIGNLLDGKDRAPLRFDYTLTDGNKKESISHSEKLFDIAEITDSIFWHPEVMGGMTPVQIFRNHADAIVGTEQYMNWKEIVKGNSSKGIQAVGPDQNQITRTWKIKCSSEYPQSPPIVYAEPEYTNDPCFRSGQLKFTTYRDERTGSPWLKCVKNSINPLKALINELNDKYHFGL